MVISEFDPLSTNLNLKTESSFKFSHLSFSEQTKTENLFIGAQIGSLTRNIKLEGD